MIPFNQDGGLVPTPPPQKEVPREQSYSNLDFIPPPPQKEVPKKEDCPCEDLLSEIIEVLDIGNSQTLTIIELLRSIDEGGKGGKGAPPTAKTPEPPDSWLSWFQTLLGHVTGGGINVAQNRFAQPVIDAAKRAPSALKTVEKFATTKIGGAAGRGIAGIARLAGPVGVVVGALGSLGDSAKALTDAFLQRGRELAQYSGGISLSQATNEVKTIMADIHEANTLERDMVRLQDATTDIWLEIRDAILPLKEFILSKMADFAEIVKGNLGDVIDFIKLVIEVGGSAQPLLKATIIDAVYGGNNSKELLRLIREGIRLDRELAEAKREKAERDAAFENMIDRARKNKLPGPLPGIAPRGDNRLPFFRQFMPGF